MASFSASRSAKWRLAFLLVWSVASFGVVFFARDLSFTIGGWPFNYWYCALGIILIYLLIVSSYAWLRRQDGRQDDAKGWAPSAPARLHELHRLFGRYVVLVLVFLALLAVGERMGMSRNWIGAVFLFATLVLYASIGIVCRTSDSQEYYVAGRRIPAIYNGMASAADWMSAASFISLAGGLYLQGFSGANGQPGGLAYIMGWTGGFCVVALLIAPNLRKHNLYTLPDYFRLRFGGRWPGLVAAIAVVFVSFTYVVAQIYGVGMITSRLTGVRFEIGIMLGLGGVLVCSFLGGMRAVTWTQVAQYVVVILAFLIPVSWLAYKQLGNPIAPLVYGQQLAKIAQLERDIGQSDLEIEVMAEYARRASAYEEKLQTLPGSLVEQREAALARLRKLKQEPSQPAVVQEASRELALLPKDATAAREAWTAAMKDNLARSQPWSGGTPFGQAFAGNPDGIIEAKEEFSLSRLNFMALMVCLMLGTAGMPHLLTRFYTTPSVAEARSSVAWSLFFISLLYMAAPALAVLMKYEVLTSLVGQNFSDLPAWIAQWSKVDPTLISATDINSDGILQFAELRTGEDIVMLASPEMGGLPYVMSGLVAAGGLAAALSTADALLLTMGNALAYDIYFRMRPKRSGNVYRVLLSKFALLLVALAAAYVAAQKPAGILVLVAMSFSLAASAFFPAMVMGIYWRGTTRAGALAGMAAGLTVCLFYIVLHAPWFSQMFGGVQPSLWFGIKPVSAGVFGAPAGAVVTWLVSVMTRHHPGSEKLQQGS